MSLWYESLGFALFDCGEDFQARAKCILAYLAMPVPRKWWEHALQPGSAPNDSHVQVLSDLRKELEQLPGMAENLDFGLLVALAFVDDPEIWHADSNRSIDEYLIRASETLARRADLAQLGQKIEEKALRPDGSR